MPSGNEFHLVLASPAPPPAFALSPASEQAPRCPLPPQRGGCGAPALRAACPGEGFGRQTFTPSTGTGAHPAPATAAPRGAAAGAGCGNVAAAGLRGEPVLAPRGPREGRAEQTRLRAAGLAQLRLHPANPRDLLSSPLPPAGCGADPLPRSAGACCPLGLARGAGVRWDGQAAWREAFLTPGLCSQRALGFCRCTAVIILVLALSSWAGSPSLRARLQGRWLEGSHAACGRNGLRG